MADLEISYSTVWTVSEYEIFTAAAPGSGSSDYCAFAVVDPLIDYKVNPLEN